MIRCQLAGASGKNFVIGSSSADLSVLDQQHHRGGGELLADRSGLEDRFGAHGDVVLDVGEPVALGLTDGALADDGHRDAGNLLPRHLGLDEAVHRARSCPAAIGSAFKSISAGTANQLSVIERILQARPAGWLMHRQVQHGVIRRATEEPDRSEGMNRQRGKVLGIRGRCVNAWNDKTLNPVVVCSD